MSLSTPFPIAEEDRAQLEKIRAEQDDPGSRIAPYAFKPGQIANPTGKNNSAKARLARSFTKALADDFERYGASVIVRARNEDPVAYLKIVASLMPKDIEIKPGEDMKELFNLVAGGTVRVVEEDGKRFIEAPVVEAEMVDITPTSADKVGGGV